MQFNSPFESRFEYFPPTPPASDGDSAQKTLGNNMVNTVSQTPAHQAAAKTGTSGAPAKVTLSLGNLPSKKDFKAVWPRTPSKV
jgi:hypothetical protein